MEPGRVIVCGLPANGIIPQLHQQPDDNQATRHINRHIVCGLPAKGIVPQLHPQPQQEADDDPPVNEEPTADQDDDVVELTEVQYRKARKLLIRIEEDEADIEPMFRIALEKMLTYARESAQLRPPKQEQGESSRGKTHRRQ
ncbi:unnamed protein product [Microthlaspi erraticum]|uniref:Uncharacterized protein n=1 Tax=Microthlaspi erraticum TaxID=1685480 RepID=A0A6D2LCK3_9BRAS|nr:unnamed protein product [Microthlaspi erraticum]